MAIPSPANFTPTLSGYSGQNAFRFWCQKVLPLVYDDSLSYYELLNKMVVYLNNVIADVASVEGNVEALLTSYEQLQTYVNNWFNEAAPEVAYQALNRMAENGELDVLIQPFVETYVAENIDGVVADQIDGAVAGQIDGAVGDQIDDTVAGQIDDVVGEQIGGAVSSQIGGAVANQIDGAVAGQIDGVVSNQIDGAVAPAVTDWLDDNVNPVGSAVIVDETLTISGAAADSEVVGYEIDGIKSAMESNFYVRTSEGAIVTINKEDVIGYSLGITLNIPYDANGYTSIGLRDRSPNLYHQLHNNQNIIPETGLFKSPAAAYEIIGPIDVRGANNLYFNCKHGGSTYALTAWSYTEDLTPVASIYSSSYSAEEISRTWDVSNADYVCISCRAADTYKQVNVNRVNTIVNFEIGGEPVTIYGGSFNFKTGELVSTYAADGTELAEPVTYTLDPVRIDMFDGVNNFIGIKATSSYAATGIVTAQYMVSAIPNLMSELEDMVEDVDGLNESMTSANSTINALKVDTVPIPTYYEEQVSENILTIRNNMVTVGANGFTFFFITDSHWNLNSKNSPALIQRIGKTLSIDTIVHGGDVVRDSGTTSNNADAVSSIRALKRTGKVFVALGNHDFYYKTTGDDTLKTYTANEIFGLLQQQESYWMKEYANGHYYTDIPGYKTRIIFLNTGAVDGTSPTLDNEQSEFLTNALSTTPSGWHIILCQHIWWKATTVTNFATAVGTILDNYNANAGSPAHVEAVFVGHNHSDRNSTTTGGIPVIETTCDRRTDTETQQGTVNEQAFDTVTIDYVNKTINMVRTGRGSSRTISYAPAP